MSYLLKLQNLISQLENHQIIHVEKADLNNGMKDWQLEMIYEAHQIKVNDEALNFYKEVNGVDIAWFVNIDEAKIERRPQDDNLEEIRGRIEIQSLQKMLRYDKYLDSLSWSSMMDEEEYSDLKNFRYIDYNDDDIRIGYIIDDARIEDNLLYLMRDSSGFGELSCKLNYYIDALIQSKGFQGWQRTFIFRDSEQLRKESNLFFYISQLFPQEEFQNFA